MHVYQLNLISGMLKAFYGVEIWSFGNVMPCAMHHAC